MSVRQRIERLHKQINPHGLVADWFAVLEGAERILMRLNPDHQPMSRKDLRQMAEDATLHGKPSEVLASVLKAAKQD